MNSFAATDLLARSTALTNIGWIGYIVVGAIAAFIAGTVGRSSRQGLLLDTVVGIIGGLLGGFLFSCVVDTTTGGWWFTLFTAMAGSVLLLGLVGQIRRL